MNNPNPELPQQNSSRVEIPFGGKHDLEGRIIEYIDNKPTVKGLMDKETYIETDVDGKRDKIFLRDERNGFPLMNGDCIILDSKDNSKQHRVIIGNGKIFLEEIIQPISEAANDETKF